jgi:hypothetical protein
MGASCTITTSLKPTTTGTFTAAIVITDNAPNSPQTITLTGIGTAPVISPPAVSGLAPSAATAGGPAFLLTVNGANFASPSSVQWNGIDLPTIYVSSAQLTASVAANLIASTGTASITVVSGSQTSAAASFSVQPSPISFHNQVVTTQAPVGSSCSRPPAVTSFLTTNNTVYLYFEASLVSGDLLSSDWLAPDNSVVPETTWKSSSGTFCFTQASLAIGQLPASKLGLWQARVYDNGKLVFTVPFTVKAPASALSGSAVLPQFVFGGGWYSALYFTNATGTAASFAVNFVGDNGTPLTVHALGGPVAQVSLPPHGTTILEAPNAGSFQEGYAQFRLPAGVYGYGVFRQSVPGRDDQEAVVPLSSAGATSNLLTWDETNFVTAVAIVNPSAIAETVTVTLLDQNGTTIGTSQFSLPPGGKTESTLRSLPGLSGMIGNRGTAQFSVSAGSVAVLGLRFSGAAFTSVPTTTSVPGANSVLPQFAFGSGWYSAMYFTNSTQAPVSFPVNFMSDTGTPLTLAALGGSATQVNLAPNGTAIIEAPNIGNLVQGYADFVLPGGVYGYGVFRQSVASRSDQEAVVPFSDAGASSNLLTWDETTYVTSVAIVNPNSNPASVAVTLWDQNGNVVGTSSLSLPPNSKIETNLSNLQGLSGMVGKRGSAQFTASNGNVSVLGLRFSGAAFTSIPTTNLTSGF